MKSADQDLLMASLNLAFCHYRSAAAVVHESHRIAVTIAEEKRDMPRTKLAYFHLKTAASIFKYLCEELIPKLSGSKEKRPPESYSWYCDLLSNVCLAGLQEVMIYSACSSSKSSPLTISKLCLGARDKYLQLDKSLGGLREMCQASDTELRTFLRFRAQFMEASAFVHLARSHVSEIRWGKAIASLTAALNRINNISIAEDAGPSIRRASTHFDRLKHEISLELNG
jgi:hypothetical protein